MEAIILAGGLGIRLAPIVSHVPKVLAPIQGRSFLSILLDQLAKSKLFSKIILSLGHKAQLVREAIEKAPLYPFAIEFAIEESPLGTGGAILAALYKIKEDVFWIVNGDTFFDVSFSDMYAFHLAKKADLSIACRWMEDRGRYGSLDMSQGGRITQLKEKSRNISSGLISGGIYLAQKHLFSSLPLKKSSLEDDFFPLFIQEGLFAYPSSGTFIDIGTPASYAEAQTILQPGNSLCSAF